jgi:hypothetical protein
MNAEMLVGLAVAARAVVLPDDGRGPRCGVCGLDV